MSNCGRMLLHTPAPFVMPSMPKAEPVSVRLRISPSEALPQRLELGQPVFQQDRT